jgi:L-ribulose-5-phosphate 3-epimerase
MNNQISRRSFLHSAGVLATSGCMGASVTSSIWAATAPPSKKRDLKKAIHVDMINVQGPLLDKLQLAKELGFNGLEINSPSNLDKKELLKACETTGLSVASVMDSVHWTDTLSDPDPAVRARGVAGLKVALNDAKFLGCHSVLLVPAVVSKQVSYADAYSRSQDEIRKVAPLAEQLGVKISLENVWNQFLLSPLEAARYVDELKSPAAAWHFDVGNIVNYGWPEQWIRILNQRIANIHVKEFSRKKRDQEGWWKGFEVELWEGDCDWPSVMKALDDVNYHGWLIAEIPGGNKERLTKIASLMDRMIACP